MLSRSYGDVEGRFKDGVSILLLPWEKPRERYRFPAPGSPCPHCGKRAGFIHTANYFECPCGTILHNEEPVPWRRDNNKILCHKHPRRREITVTCQRCGKEFGTHNHNGMVKFCPDCRDDARAEHQRVTDRERKARKKNSKLAVRSDDATAGRVEMVAAVNVTQKGGEATS